MKGRRTVESFPVVCVIVGNLTLQSDFLVKLAFGLVAFSSSEALLHGIYGVVLFGCYQSSSNIIDFKSCLTRLTGNCSCLLSHYSSKMPLPMEVLNIDYGTFFPLNLIFSL